MCSGVLVDTSSRSRRVVPSSARGSWLWFSRDMMIKSMIFRFCLPRWLMSIPYYSASFRKASSDGNPAPPGAVVTPSGACVFP